MPEVRWCLRRGDTRHTYKLYLLDKMRSNVVRRLQKAALGVQRATHVHEARCSPSFFLSTLRCSSSSSSSMRSSSNAEKNAEGHSTVETEEGTAKSVNEEVAEGEHKEALAEEIKEAIANQRSKPPPSIVDQILTMLGIKTGTPFTYSTAKTLLDNCILGSKKIYWFDDNKGRIGKDFRSRHTLLLIYIWMVHKRLLKMDNGQDVQVGSAHTYIHT